MDSMLDLCAARPGPEWALAFYDHLEAEVLDNAGFLGPEHHACLCRYYGTLGRNVALRPFYRYNWAHRVAPMIELVLALPLGPWALSDKESPWRILDAGCGVGTESIFWGVLREDVEVVGVDIAPDRLEVAKARQAAYERRLGRALNLSFREQDVLSALGGQGPSAPRGHGASGGGRFDLIWAMESISHIDPAQEFLARAYQSLGPGGVLVISDSHLLNPAMFWRVLRLRASGVQERTTRTLAGGERLSYAQECLFTVGQMSRMLRRAGFRSVRSHLGVFSPPALARSSLAFKVGKWLDSFLPTVPWVRNLGGIYTIVALK